MECRKGCGCFIGTVGVGLKPELQILMKFGGTFLT
jgi:hypothetical protein